MICFAWHFFFLQTHEHLKAWEKSKFESVFLLDLLLHHWFFIDLQMPTEWECAFLNTATKIFCLIYFLNIPHTNQNLSFYLFKVQYQSLQNWHFGDISPYSSQRWSSHMKIIQTFCFVWFYHFHGGRSCVWFYDKYKVHSFFILCRLSAGVYLIIQGLLIVMRKPTRNAWLGSVEHEWT